MKANILMILESFRPVPAMPRGMNAFGLRPCQTHSDSYKMVFNSYKMAFNSYKMHFNPYKTTFNSYKTAFNPYKKWAFSDTAKRRFEAISHVFNISAARGWQARSFFSIVENAAQS